MNERVVVAVIVLVCGPVVVSGSVGDDLMKKIVFDPVDQVKEASGGGAVAFSGAHLPAVGSAPESQN